MIYTITFAPAIDYWIEINDFQLNQVNRFQNANLYPGGKGINAAIILKRHQIKTTAISFFNQQSLELINHFLVQEDLVLENIATEPLTRINVKCYSTNNYFELNGAKPEINHDHLEQLFSLLNKIQPHDLVMIMGKVDHCIVLSVLEFLAQKKIAFIIDTDSTNNHQYLQYQPLVIKPNLFELKTNYHFKIDNQNDLYHAMSLLQQQGAKYVIVSQGENGSVLLDHLGNFYQVTINCNNLKVASATGAGDSLIALFSALVHQGINVIDAFVYANAAAVGTVSQSWLGNQVLTEKYLAAVKIKLINCKS
ncbi:PfkB family carbohydrate kinase [[Mycoplasma] cavipharyngis]|uniref:PfkB family carbohydrate kinase n=1 Tax=[Mycoplasma] cavipharyngis TaxID=92757 RepID=UPI00370444FE